MYFTIKFQLLIGICLVITYHVNMKLNLELKNKIKLCSAEVS